jgi:ornithine cyclodeaminase
MSRFYNLTQIKNVLKKIQPIQEIEEGFVAYSQGKTEIPPVGEMLFKKPPGDVHIKYGYIVDDAYYAAAGAVTAKYLAPKHIDCIGIVGAGTQGRMQLEFLESVIDCKDVMVWGMYQKELDEYMEYMKLKGYNIQTTLKTEEIMANCNLIITATPSKTPLLSADLVREGTHITAMGSDTSEKQELDPRILQKADIVVADSISQCLLRGEIHQALKAGVLEKERVVELGKVIVNPELQRTSEKQTTIADLTGVAVQDIQIAKAVYNALVDENKNQALYEET